MSDYQDGDYIHDTQWLAMKRAIDGNGILTGCALTAPGGLNTTLGVGTYIAGNTKVTIAAPVGFIHSAADPTYDRWDIIYGTSGAQLKAEGTPSIAPSPPDLPAGAILFQMVRVVAGAVNITTGNIYDFGFTSTLREHASRHFSGGTDIITPANIGAEPAFSKNTAFNKDFGTGTANVPAIGATLGNSQVVETNASGALITAAKNSAYNKVFGTGTANVPAIGATLGNSQIVETNASGALITATKGTSYNKAFETSTANILMNGAVSVGSSANVPRADHIHPIDTSRAPTSHAVDANTYGWGSTSVFGHLKVGSGLGVSSGIISLASHDHTYHSDRTRRLFIPVTEMHHYNGAVITTTWTLDSLARQGFGVLMDDTSKAAGFSFTAPKDIISTSSTVIVYLIYSWHGGCGGTSPIVRLSRSDNSAGAVPSTTWTINDTSLDIGCSSYATRRTQILSSTQVWTDKCQAMGLHMNTVGTSPIVIIGVEIEYTADM